MDPVVWELRTICQFEDFVTAGKNNQVRWLMNVLSALRTPGLLLALKLTPDATDGERFQKFSKFPGDRQKLLLKGGCDLSSAIQATAHIRRMYLNKPRTAWDREAERPTGALDKMKSASIGGFFRLYA